jgi:hydrogenase maturation protease
MIETKNKVLILGLGNYLMCDEGVGVHFIQRLEKNSEGLPAHVDLLDGGTAGFLLMDYLESYPSVVMIDATLDKNPPGTIRLIEPKFAKDFPKAMSTHEIGLKDLVESLSLMGRLPKIYLFVVSVADIASLHVGLTVEVEKAMPELRRRVFEIATQLVNQHLPEVAVH